MPRWDGTPSFKDRVREFFAERENEWLPPRAVGQALGITTSQARGAMESLVGDGILIRGTEGESGESGDRRTIQRTYRTKRGFLKTSKFEPGPWAVEVIWVEDTPFIGPFCKHCGNSLISHGPNYECLNYRIHPLLPVGDLPKRKADER